MSGQALAVFLGMPGQSMLDLLARADIHKTEKGFPVREAARALIAHYRTESKRLETSTTEARARQAQADAEASEINTAKKKGELVSLRDSVALWDDGHVRIRQCIEEAAYIKPEHRERLTKAILEIKLE